MFLGFSTAVMLPLPMGRICWIWECQERLTNSDPKISKFQGSWYLRRWFDDYWSKSLSKHGITISRWASRRLKRNEHPSIWRSHGQWDSSHSIGEALWAASCGNLLKGQSQLDVRSWCRCPLWWPRSWAWQSNQRKYRWCSGVLAGYDLEPLVSCHLQCCIWSRG